MNNIPSLRIYIKVEIVSPILSKGVKDVIFGRGILDVSRANQKANCFK
jgi:hypothetical protein